MSATFHAEHLPYLSAPYRAALAVRLAKSGSPQARRHLAAAVSGEDPGAAAYLPRLARAEFARAINSQLHVRDRGDEVGVIPEVAIGVLVALLPYAPQLIRAAMTAMQRAMAGDENIQAALDVIKHDAATLPPDSEDGARARVYHAANKVASAILASA